MSRLRYYRPTRLPQNRHDWRYRSCQNDHCTANLERFTGTCRDSACDKIGNSGRHALRSLTPQQLQAGDFSLRPSAAERKSTTIGRLPR